MSHVTLPPIACRFTIAHLCNTLQHTATPCHTLQHPATHWHTQTRVPPSSFFFSSQESARVLKNTVVPACPWCSPWCARPGCCRPGRTGLRWTGLASALIFLPSSMYPHVCTLIYVISCIYPHFSSYERSQHLCAYTHMYILNFFDSKHSGAEPNLNSC